MGKYKVVVSLMAERHLRAHLKSGNKIILNKIEIIFRELSNNPFEGTGKPEKLKYNLAGFWSRRISQKDRIIYKVEDAEVKVYILSAMGHYGDR